jgi:4'-phosphopantetheinyl transferase
MEAPVAPAADTPARVDLWIWDLSRPDPGQQAGLFGLLSPEERERADRYAYADDRGPFIVARGRLREILGQYVSAEPMSLAFTFGRHGKPALIGEGAPHFNFSDSGSLGCLAVTHAGPVGVDIEQMRPRDYLGLADRYFSAAEYDVLEAMQEPQHRDAFFRGWTRKEAFLKAVGSGLSTRLDAFDVTMDDQPPRILRIDPAIDPDLEQWSLHHFTPAPNYMGAVALRGGGGHVDVVIRQGARG